MTFNDIYISILQRGIGIAQDYGYSGDLLDALKAVDNAKEWRESSIECEDPLELTHRALHDDISDNEVKQCFLETYVFGSCTMLDCWLTDTFGNCKEFDWLSL